MRLFVVTMLINYSFNGLANDQWPGNPPDCWQTPRLVHAGTNDLAKTIEIDKVPLIDFKRKQYSPNKGYYFYISELGSQQRTIYIYAEKGHLSKIEMENVHAISDQKWINEKLLFLESGGEE